MEEGKPILEIDELVIEIQKLEQELKNYDEELKNAGRNLIQAKNIWDKKDKNRKASFFFGNPSLLILFFELHASFVIVIKAPTIRMRRMGINKFINKLNEGKWGM